MRTAILIAYLAIAIFTNAYCQSRRWDDWKEGSVDRTDKGQYETAVFHTFFASAGWPVYWSSRLCFCLVENPAPESPEVEKQLRLLQFYLKAHEKPCLSCEASGQ